MMMDYDMWMKISASIFLLAMGFFHVSKVKLQHLFNTDVNNNYSKTFRTTSTATVAVMGAFPVWVR
jgi:hypothetical protein